MLKHLSALSGAEQDALILRAAQEDPLDTAAFLLRLCHDYADSGPSPALRWLDVYIGHARQQKPELFLTLWLKMPDSTVALRTQALLVVEECLKLPTPFTATT